MTFDLASIDLKADSERGSWLHLKDPRTGAPIYADKERTKPCRLHVLGPESDAVKSVSETVEKEREKREASRNVYDAQGKLLTRGESTKEELTDDDVAVYVAATIGWENLSFNGSEKFTKETVAALFTERKWAGRQVFHWMTNYANFIQGQGSS